MKKLTMLTYLVLGYTPSDLTEIKRINKIDKSIGGYQPIDDNLKSPIGIKSGIQNK